MKKITIEPVTRIEGHAKVTIHLKDDGKVDKAFFHVNEWRGFEKFCEGRPYWEMLQITPRICGICPVSHHLASVKACDVLAGIKPTRPAALLRELMHMGQVIQSHSMHFLELAAPDLLLGFDAAPAIRNVAGLAQANPDLAKKAIALRAFGQDIIRSLGGRRIHTLFGVPGGVNKALTEAERDAILQRFDENLESVKLAMQLAKKWYDANLETVNAFAVFPSAFMGMVAPDGSMDLYDGQIKMIDRHGRPLELFDASDYLEYVGEHVEDWSYLKFPFYRKVGWPDGTYRVGPLARCNVSTHIRTPMANQELKNFKQLNNGKPVEGTLWYHYARLIEDLHAMERAQELLLDPDILSTDLMGEQGTPARDAVGCIEAPRGTLFHHYKVDEHGLLTGVNLIVATGHNNAAMSKSVESVAKHFVDGKRLSEGMLNRVEAAVRAHDPCLSCSTHAVGKMPMHIELYSREGELLDTLHKDR